MKAIVFFLMFIFLASSAFAISISTQETYQPGETFISEIQGNILQPIYSEDVGLKRKNVQVPWEYDLKRLGDRYFIYGVLPDSENTYTLIINEIITTVNGKTEEITFQQNLTVIGEHALYSVKPGFVITQGDFELSAFLYSDFLQTININYPEETTLDLSPGQNIFTFSTFNTEPGFREIQFGDYTIPLLIISDEPEIEYLPPLRFFPRNIESIIFLEDPLSSYPFEILNSGDVELIDLELDFNRDLFLIEPLEISRIPPDARAYFNLSLRDRTPIDEVITLRSGDLEFEFPIVVDYTERESEADTPYLQDDYTETQAYFCSELNGRICTAQEACSIENVNALDTANCCLGSCIAQEQESVTSFAWIGYMIALVVLLVLVIIGGRYLKSRKNKANPMKAKISKAEKSNSSFSLRKPS